MDKQLARVHYFHADATALGGFITDPFHQIIPVQAPLSLPPVGGSATAHACCFRIPGIVSFRSAHTRVSGTPSDNGPWTTVASAVIEGLDVLDGVLTADQVISQIRTEHPPEGYTPRVSFAETNFVGLKIKGRDVNPVWDFNLCGDFDAGYPARRCVQDSAFLDRVNAQYERMSKSNGSESLKRRYQYNKADDRLAAKGAVVCSLVQELQGDFPGTRCGNVVELDKVGKIFLAEVVADCTSFQLIMLRFELGCKTSGAMACGGTKGNGVTQP